MESLFKYLMEHPDLAVIFMAGAFWARHEIARKNGKAPLSRDDLNVAVRPMVESLNKIHTCIKEQNAYARGVRDYERRGG